ncbi:MAG: DNA-directed RNA polymerase alpha subunit, partial [uncultured Solirubrobacteraceae bacterium]
ARLPDSPDHRRNGGGQPWLVHGGAPRPRLRLHVRELPASRAARLAGRRRGDLRAHRGGRARVLDHQGRHRGRHGHRPQPQGHRLPDALRRDRGRGPARRHGPGRDHREGHRPALRRRDPQPGRAHRDAREEDEARAVPDDRPRPRLHAGRGQQVPRPADRRHPDRLDLLAGPPRGVLRRGRARRAAHRLRQAHARHRDGRVHRPHRRAARGRRDPHLVAVDLHGRGPHRGAARRPLGHGHRERRRPGGRRRERPRGRRRPPRRRPDGRHPHRGARARRALLQLPQAGGHPDRRRPRLEVRGRAQRDPELRQEVDRRGHRDPRAARPRAAQRL